MQKEQAILSRGGIRQIPAAGHIAGRYAAKGADVKE